MSFRNTLAVALMPVAIVLGVRGGDLWWLAMGAIALVMADVALLRYTTLRTVRRFELEDAFEERDELESWIKRAQGLLTERSGDNLERLTLSIAEKTSELERLNERIATLERFHSGRSTALLERLLGPESEQPWDPDRAKAGRSRLVASKSKPSRLG